MNGFKHRNEPKQRQVQGSSTLIAGFCLALGTA